MLSNFKKIFFSYFFLLAFFLVSMFLTCLIPSSFLSKNIGKSVETLKKEGMYPSFGVSWRKIALDNFTDSLMLNTAYSVDSGNPFRSSLVNIRYDGDEDSLNQVVNLEKLYLHGKVHVEGYERYWHGYLIYLRPLLVFFSYSQIRIIITFLLISAFYFLIYISWKKLGKQVAIPLIFGFVAVDFFYIGRSMQFSGVFLIGLVSAIYLLLKDKKIKNPYTIFFVVGGLTSFFDLLTSPLVSLEILLIISLYLKKDSPKKILWNIFFWFTGYLSLWFSKWLIVQVLFAPEALSTALSVVVHRTINKADANFSQLNTIKLNLNQLRGYDKTNKIIILCLFIAGLVYSVARFDFHPSKLKKIPSLLIIGFLPYLWYLVAANHSYIHVWYTYRTQFVSVVCFFLIIVEFTTKSGSGRSKKVS